MMWRLVFMMHEGLRLKLGNGWGEWQGCLNGYVIFEL